MDDKTEKLVLAPGIATTATRVKMVRNRLKEFFKKKADEENH